MSEEYNGHVYTRLDDTDPYPQDTCTRCGTKGADAAFGRPCVSSQPGEAEWEKIRQWMVIKFEQDLAEIGRKAIEYGGRDFDIMGKALETLLPGTGQLDPQTREIAGKEMAVAFYALGKASRLFSAWERGQPPSDDSWFDLGVYALMARYVRENGRWM